MMYGDWSWWWMLPMMIFMVVVVGAVIWGIIAVTRAYAPPGPPSQATPEDILHERFARGEIDVIEYRERMDALHDRRRAAPH